MSDIVKGLIITGIGMGLVFVVIILLWGVMAGLVALTSGRRRKKEPREIVEREAVSEPGDMDNALRQKAAAAAVACALSASAVGRQAVISGNPAGTASSWLTAGRARQLNDQNLRGRSQ